MAIPLGIVVTVAACIFVVWWQGLSYSNPYAQAVFINGKLFFLHPSNQRWFCCSKGSYTLTQRQKEQGASKHDFYSSHVVSFKCKSMFKQAFLILVIVVVN